MKKLPLALCLFAASYGSAQKPSVDYSDALLLVDRWLEAERDYKHLPALSVSITKDQELLWSKAYGQSNVANKVAATPGTIYSICSISKLFTAIAIMQLHDEGKLRLDDSIESILKDFQLKQQFKESGPITIRSLLTHSSGLPRESEYPYWTGPDFPFPTQDQVNSKLKDQQTLYPASTYFQYSNLGLTLLGEIIEKVSGKKYNDYVEEKILKPLGLAATHPYLPATEHGKKMAIGYSALNRDGNRVPVALFDARGITSAAGYSSNVEDLGRFASWQFRLLETGGVEVLKASTLKEMQRVQWMDPDWTTSWGLGFEVSKEGSSTIVGHGGSCPGYRTVLDLDPKEKMAYSVMINAGGENPDLYAKEIRELLAKTPKEKQSLEAGVDLTKFAGNYSAQPWGAEAIVTPWYGDLAVVSVPSTNPDEAMSLLRHVKGNTFRRVRRDKTLGEEVVFETDASGKVTRYRWHSNYTVKIK